MGIENKLDRVGAPAAKTERHAVKKHSIEDERELDAIEDDEVRQILKIPPRRKAPKKD